MKKSRIIVPALAMLTLSVAASVTGTVAWFTASRTASMTASSLAAVNTAGNLSLVLKKGNQEANPSSDSIALQPMRDFSYDIKEDKGFYAVLDAEGKNIIATKEATKGSNGAEWQAHQYNGTNYLYFANIFTGTFSTTALDNQYLFFNTNKTKSYVANNGTETELTITDASIYKALRVGMVAKTGEAIKRVVWAPYTTLNSNEVFNLTNAGTLSSELNVTTNHSVNEYKETTTDKALAAVTHAPIYNESTNPNPVSVVKQSDTDPVSEATVQSDAANDFTCLSVGLKNGVSTTVSFTIWFEGLDPNCKSSDSGINIASAISKTTRDIKMNFFAIPENSFANA